MVTAIDGVYGVSIRGGDGFRGVSNGEGGSGGVAGNFCCWWWLQSGVVVAVIRGWWWWLSRAGGVDFGEDERE